MKGTVFAEQGTFFNITPLLFEGFFFWNSTPINHSPCPKKYTRLLTIGQKWGALNLQNTALHGRDLLENPHRRVGMQALQTVWVWLRSVYNIGHFTWSTMYLLRWISPDILGNFLQLHSRLASPLNNVRLVMIGQWLRPLYLVDTLHSRLYLAFNSREFSEIRQLSLTVHGLSRSYVWGFIS